MFSSIFKSFIELATFQRAPQDIPPSRALMLIAFAIWVTLGLLVGTLQSGALNAFGQKAVDIVVVISFLYAGLGITKHRERILQAFTAICGAEIIVGIVALPLVLTNMSAQSALPAFLVLSAWNLAILGHIFRHTFNTHFFIGVLLAIWYAIIIGTLNMVIFMEKVPAATQVQ